MQTASAWQDIFRNAIKMEIGEVLTCPGMTVPNDRRNTDIEIVLSNSDDNNE